MQRVRTAAFREILATGRPVPIIRLAAATATGEADVRAAANRLLAAGRARIDEHGNVTAAAGLSVTPTRHRLQTRHGSRWTNCAYDALGILGALGTDGEITSSSPLTGAAHPRSLRARASDRQRGGAVPGRRARGPPTQ